MKIQDKTESNFQTMKKMIEADKLVKVAVYFGLGVVSLYIIGKTFSVLALTVRGYNDLKSAINGK